jgi:acetyl-CoA C-acetyltransferase
MMEDNRVPVIVGVGELADRPDELAGAREPISLMEMALRRAERDAGAALLARLDGLEIINEISWPYPDPCALLTERLGVTGVECTYHPVGGQTPMLAIHRAALAIQAGSWRAAAICGAEAQASVTAAARAGIDLPWHPKVADFVPTRGAAYQRPIARALDFATPAHVYPFYETATRTAWRQTLAEAQAESGTIWANNASIARQREAAWMRRDISPEAIVSRSTDNRMIAWPYTKLMMANPGVNQGAAVIVCSLALARELGIGDDRIIHIQGGAAADEPRDYLKRRTYRRSPAMEWVLDRAAGLVGGSGFDAVELYSCFPVVPKMARRTLGIAADAPLSVAGGLTFFGAPLNNFMTHAAVAMVERLRRTRGRGLLYAQGEYVTKHHALVIGTDAPAEPLSDDHRRPDDTDLATEAVGYSGPARAEAATVLYDRAGAVRHGGVLLTTPAAERLLARVPARDGETIAAITSDDGVVDGMGMVSIASDGTPEWRVD